MATTTRSIKWLLEEHISCDQVSKTRSGTFILRQGFFYKHGQTAEKFATRTIAAIKEKLGLNVELVGMDEVNKPFRGGGTTAQNSHFWVEVKIS